jgi:hypothetical protein
MSCKIKIKEHLTQYAGTIILTIEQCIRPALLHFLALRLRTKNNIARSMSINKVFGNMLYFTTDEVQSYCCLLFMELFFVLHH